MKLDGFVSEGKVISIELFICSNEPQTRENDGTCACRNMCGIVVSVEVPIITIMTGRILIFFQRRSVSQSQC